MKVKNIMTRRVLTVKPTDSVEAVAKVLYKRGFTGVPVIDAKRRLLGIVTEWDLVVRNARLDLPVYLQLLDGMVYFENPGKLEKEIERAVGVKVREVMTEKVVTITPDATVEDLATLMERKHVNPVPVVKDGKLVGIVSKADIIALMVAKRKRK